MDSGRGGGQGRTHRFGQFGGVQAPGGRSDAELVHPVGGRRRLLLPARLAVEDQESVPGGLLARKAEIENGPLWRGDGVVRVEVVAHARVVHAARGSARSARQRLGAQAAQHPEPDDVDAEVGIGNGFEHGAVDFGDPPKAGGSSGVDEEQQADAAGVAVEGRAQRLARRRERGKRWRLFRRCAQGSGQGEEHQHSSGEQDLRAPFGRCWHHRPRILEK